MELSTMGGRRLTSQQLQQIQQIQQQQQQHFTQRQQRLHNRHYRKDTAATLGKNVSKYMYPPSSPSLQCNENIYHPQTQPRRSNNLYPEDPDIIEVFLEDDPIKLKERHDPRETIWRNNIVATMERYEPAPGMISATLPSSYLHHQHQLQQQQLQQQQHQQFHQLSADNNLNAEYSYAYCEPVMTKPQQQPNIPQIHKIPSSVSSNALSSKLPSTNSLRALLSKSFRKGSTASQLSNDRHTFTNRYGTKENIYEDIGAGNAGGVATGGSKGKPASPSSQSFDSVNKLNFQEELRQVQTHHDRIMNQLSLSVETLIMPTKDEQDKLEERMNELQLQLHDEMSQDDMLAAGASAPYHHAHGPLMALHLQHERLSPTTSQPNIGDVDSGISGSSSSGASYASSMFYRTTASLYPNKSIALNDVAESDSPSSITIIPPSSSNSATLSVPGCSQSTIRSSFGRPTIGPLPVHTPTSSVGFASCSKLASNVVIPNANKLSCCFYSDNNLLSNNSTNSRKNQSESSDPSISDTGKSNFWNKLGKLRLSGVFGGNNSGSQSSSMGQRYSQQHQATATSTNTMPRLNGNDV